MLCVDFHGAVLRVVDAGTDRARAVVERGGRIGSNKGVIVDPPPSLPALTEKDVAAIAIGTWQTFGQSVQNGLSGATDTFNTGVVDQVPAGNGTTGQGTKP